MAADNVVALAIPPEELVRVAPGEYLATYVRHEGSVVFKTAKVRIDFRIIEHPDLVLPRWFRVDDYRQGRIRASRHSDIVRELSVALGRRVRHDRIPVSMLEGVLVRVLVKTVMRDSRPRPIAEINRYSVIQNLIEGVEP